MILTKEQKYIFDWLGWSVNKGLRYLEIKKNCYFDEKKKIMIHIFDIHSFKCRCGQRAIRKPIKDDNVFSRSVFDD